ncbi:uncharacterized protein EV154DRAFT_487940 [Mucor mucedo]|uniref:uncharacterized protein n=1 Tax=Mucor mucedo TaxID=29922 RepID=UPI0022202004|nr:uncharacterized protein EV154DRAFT_487940 [Mucor mucedo]KAI7869636.1 hypothetical protein EV154DRAFT_487940 [Mucor mucedo]
MESLEINLLLPFFLDGKWENVLKYKRVRRKLIKISPIGMVGLTQFRQFQEKLVRSWSKYENKITCNRHQPKDTLIKPGLSNYIVKKVSTIRECIFEVVIIFPVCILLPLTAYFVNRGTVCSTTTYQACYNLRTS